MPPLTEAQQELYDWLLAYVHEHQHPPSIRQMMKAMQLRSPAPIQSRLKHLQAKGYLDWQEGQARTLRLLYNACPPAPGIRILGQVTDGDRVTWMEPKHGQIKTPSAQGVALGLSLYHKDCYALRLQENLGHSQGVLAGDYLICKRLGHPRPIAPNTIVVVHLETWGLGLKYWCPSPDSTLITLLPIYDEGKPLTLESDQIQLHSYGLGIWRNLDPNANSPT